MKSIEEYEQMARDARPCRHENADHLKPGEVLIRVDGTDLHEVKCEQFRCIDCGAWLSLGASNDLHPPAERRLARLIADIHCLWQPSASRDEAIEIAIDDCATSYASGECFEDSEP